MLPVTLVLLALLAVALGLYEPVALMLAAPWLIALLWVLARHGRGVEALPPAPSMAESARRRLAVR